MTKHIILLFEVCNNLLNWSSQGLISFDGTAYDELRRLFKVESVYDIDETSLSMLAGPHGFTAYKMLLARSANEL